MMNLRLGYTNPTGAFFQFRLRQDTTIEDRMHPEYHSGSAKFGVAQLGLQGLNRGIQFINQMIQTSRLEDAWKKMKPHVLKELERAAGIRVLILAYYSKLEKRGVEVESPLEHVEAFQGLAVTYGYTRGDCSRT